MASYILIVAFAAFCLASCDGVAIDARISDNRNIDQCEVDKAIKNLLATNINEKAKFLGVRERIVTYPETGINSRMITCLKVINMDTSNHGGRPEIISGGVGAYDVQIRLTSQIGQPLNFRIEIWADKDPCTGADCD